VEKRKEKREEKQTVQKPRNFVKEIRGPCIKSKFNNIAHLLTVRFFAAFSQPTHTIVSSSLLIYGSLISLTKFFGFCA